MNGDRVQVVYVKYDGRPHRSYPAQWLGVDDAGTWLGVAHGTPALVDGGREAVREEPYVLLIPRKGWWTAMFNAPPRRSEIYCDVTTPAVWDGTDQATIIDLDLDVRRRRTGEIEVLDVDEFELHRTLFHYPRHVVRQARAASRWLATALGDGTEPFVDAFRPWLAKVTRGG